MKVWSAIFNIIAVIIIAMIIIVINKIDATNQRQFEEIRLSYAVDYAVEASFRASIATDSIGTDYVAGGLEEVKLNPTLVLDTFYNVLSLSYDKSMSEDNFEKIKQSIVTGVMCAVDGYYILEEVEVDNNPYDVIIGGEYDLRWGVKRPYLVYNEIGDRLFAANLVNQKTIEYIPKEKQILVKPTDDLPSSLIYRATYNSDTGDDIGKGTTGLTSEIVKHSISKLITEDINYAIHIRNLNTTNKKINSFYLPTSESMTAINELKSPSIILLFQDSSFLNGYNLDVTSVGGTRVKTKSNVIGFTIAGSSELYYCYAGQQLGKDKEGNQKRSINIVARFDTLHEAALAGYKPHFDFLSYPFGD